MYKLKEFYKKIPAFFKNKYFITTLIFLIWINFLNDDPPHELIKNLKEKNKIEKDIRTIEEKNNDLNAKLTKLETDKEELETYAREEFHMKKEEETLIIIKEKPRDQKNNTGNKNNTLNIFIISLLCLVLTIGIIFLIKKHKRR